MTAGSVLAVPAVVLVATAQNLVWFFSAWLLVGAAMGAVLYPPAFAALTRSHGPDPVRALTVLTWPGAGQHGVRADDGSAGRSPGLADDLPGARRDPGGDHDPGALVRPAAPVAATTEARTGHRRHRPGPHSSPVMS